MSAEAAKEGPALQPPLFFWWESSDVTLVVLTECARPRCCLPASALASRSARPRHYSPAGLMTEYYSLCISENRPPWRRFDLESTPLQSQVFQPWNRRRFLRSAEKVLTGRSLEEVCCLFSLQTGTICGGGGSAWKRCFFCAQEDNSQYIGLWLEALNSVLLKAADACLDYNYRLSTIPFSAANNFRQTPAHRHSGNEVFILIS